MTTPRSPKRTMSMPVIAATTAALPAVVLSSLALAQPSMATPAPQPRKIPATLAAAMKAQAVNVGSVIPANAVAATIPTTLRPMAPSVPDSTRSSAGTPSAPSRAASTWTPTAVLQLNKLSATTLIYPGQTIKLTGTAPAAPAKPAPAAPAAPSAPSAPSSASVYTVVPGDTLGAIAAKHGVPLSSIFSWNGLEQKLHHLPGPEDQGQWRIRAISTRSAGRPGAGTCPFGRHGLLHHQGRRHPKFHCIPPRRYRSLR